MKNNNINSLLEKDWFLFRSSPNEFLVPSKFELIKQNLIPTSVPSTVASSINLDKPDCWTPNINYDDFDWWYCKKFEITEEQLNGILVLEGLATLADVWINDKHILTSENMFLHHTIDMDKVLIEGQNRIALCFRSLSEKLKLKHPRPKWKTKLVTNQSLRWYRTTLLGRIPGWTPPISPVGPWKSIYLINKTTPQNIQIKTSILNDHQNISGQVKFKCAIKSTSEPSSAKLTVGNIEFPLSITANNTSHELTGDIEINDLRLWWPHTHGVPHLYEIEITITINSIEQTKSLPPIGFKAVKLEQENECFKIIINQVPIFCRGVCWTINDIVSLLGTPEDLRRTLMLLRDAGTNMLRIGGTMIYEQNLFHELCDELGIMIWQDFMFANMDYPFEDTVFLEQVKKEVIQQINRLSGHASTTIFCGNSEIQQQISMQGFEKSMWEIPFFDKSLKELCNELYLEIPYITSSPTGKGLPFHTKNGLSHYYGIGAYLRPINELRLHDVKFTPECLGFANIPVETTRNSILNGHFPITHNPVWKQRTPRDSGAGWDFEDVRDHYLEEFYNVNARELRSFEPERYMQLSEIITGEVMSRAFSEWRSKESNCWGGLVWFAKDLWPGAGWGIIDSNNQPKACYHYLKNIWQPINISITNEAINGIDIHLTNNTSNSLDVRTKVLLLNQNGNKVFEQELDVFVEKRNSKNINLEHNIDRFIDIANAYKFGPSNHDYIYASLIKDDSILSDAFLSLDRSLPTIQEDVDIKCFILNEDEKEVRLEIVSNKLLMAASFRSKELKAINQFVNLIPKQSTIIIFGKTTSSIAKNKFYLSAINLKNELLIKIN